MKDNSIAEHMRLGVQKKNRCGSSEIIYTRLSSANIHHVAHVFFNWTHILMEEIVNVKQTMHQICFDPLYLRSNLDQFFLNNLLKHFMWIETDVCLVQIHF